MITRIPQPQFVGPAPSEVVTQAGDNGTKIAGLFANSFQEGVKNYMAQKQLAQQKDLEEQRLATEKAMNEATNASNQAIESMRSASATKQLQMNLLYDSLAKGAAAAESPGQHFLENQSQYKQLYTFVAGGNKELADSMMQEHAKGLSSMSPVDIFKQGSIGYGQPGQPATSPAGPPPTSQLGAFAPAAAPQAPVPNQPVAPSPMAQAANPQGSPTAMGASPVAAPVPSRLPPVTPATSQNAQTSITMITKGLPNNAATQTANSTLAKVQSIAMGEIDPLTQFSAKEQASVQSVVRPMVKVLKNSQAVKDWLDAGGDEAALQKAADWMNGALKDPTFSKWFDSASQLTPEEAKSLNTSALTDEKIRQITENIENAYARTAATAAYDQARINMAANTIKLKGSQQEVTLLGDYQRAVATFAQVYDTTRQGFINAAKDKGASVDDASIKALMDKEFQNGGSGLSMTLDTATRLYQAVTHDTTPLAQVQLSWEGRASLGQQLLPFLFGEGEQPGGVTVPTPPPVGGPKPNPQGQPKPTAPPTAAGSLTPRQKANVMKGLPPGPA
jgi:hypothetical protein